MARTRLTREQSQQRTRELLLEAAADVFSRHGFHAASVEQVAERAGFSKGAVYSNFANKEDLFLVLLDRHLEGELRALAHLFTPAGPAEEMPDAVPDAPFPRHLAERRSWNVLTMEFWLYAMRDETARQRLAARYQAARAELAARLAQRYAVQGVTPPLSVEHLAWTMLALGSGLALQAYLAPGALPDTLFRATMDHLLDSPATGDSEAG